MLPLDNLHHKYVPRNNSSKWRFITLSKYYLNNILRFNKQWLSIMLKIICVGIILLIAFRIIISARNTNMTQNVEKTAVNANTKLHNLNMNNNNSIDLVSKKTRNIDSSIQDDDFNKKLQYIIESESFDEKNDELLNEDSLIEYLMNDHQINEKFNTLKLIKQKFKRKFEKPKSNDFDTLKKHREDSEIERLSNHNISFLSIYKLEDDIRKLLEEKFGSGLKKQINNLFKDEDEYQFRNPLDPIDSRLLIDQNDRAERIKFAFLHAWNGYSKYAWGHDEVNPITNQPYDSWGSLGATIVDSLDTLYLMGLNDEFEKCKDFVRRIRFDQDAFVSFFETSIRYLGGLLGAFDLSKDKIFLVKAKELADRLLPAFDSPSGLPYHQVNLKTGEVRNPSWTGSKSILSEVGSVQLEWKYLSHHTDTSLYWDKVEKVMKVLEKAKRDHSGLFPLLIDERTGEFSGSKVSWGGLGDSFYEYLLKQFLLTNKVEKNYEEMYINAVLDMKKYLMKKSVKGDLFIAEMEFDSTQNDFEHLACFIPGMLVLGAEEIYSRRIDENLAVKLLETCVSMYTDNESGLPPDHIRFRTEGIDRNYDVINGKYILRPETIESLYYLYKHTGDEKWREIAWEIFLNIEKHCKTDSAFSGIVDATKSNDNLEKNAAMETFFTAETLKYLYLIFKPNLINLQEKVITTEAHILSRFNKKEFKN